MLFRASRESSVSRVNGNIYAVFIIVHERQIQFLTKVSAQKVGYSFNEMSLHLIWIRWLHCLQVKNFWFEFTRLLQMPHKLELKLSEGCPCSLIRFNLSITFNVLSLGGLIIWFIYE